ncbi:MAG: hypothetical protein IJG48_01965 [Mogibacterium sp.]|nr:hypothetical protein [Mogibacterium sp.]
MNTIFLTVPATEKAEESVSLEGFREKAKEFLGDERVRTTLKVISCVAPLAAGPMASAAGRVLPTVAKGLKYAPHAINCVMTLTQV